jgi:hypothetical protein
VEVYAELCGCQDGGGGGDYGASEEGVNTFPDVQQAMSVRRSDGEQWLVGAKKEPR